MSYRLYRVRNKHYHPAKGAGLISSGFSASLGQF